MINQGAILLYENKYLNQYPELKDYQILSDIINVSSSIQLFNSDVEVRIDLNKLGTLENYNNVRVFSINNEELQLLEGNLINDYLNFYVNQLQSYIVVYDVNNQDSQSEVPSSFGITACYPNPFNPVTYIDYSVDLDSKVSVFIYNINGRKVKTIESEFKTAGLYKTSWDGRNNNGTMMPSGVYFIEIKNSFSKDVSKITLLK